MFSSSTWGSSRASKRNRGNSLDNTPKSSWLLPAKRANSAPPFGTNSFLDKVLKSSQPPPDSDKGSLSWYRNLLSFKGVDYSVPKEYCSVSRDTRFKELVVDLQLGYDKLSIKPEEEAKQLERVDRIIEDDKNAAGGGRIKELIAARKADIPQDEQEKFRGYFSHSEDHSIVINKFSVEMSRAKISCLKPSTWLNDEVINFYMEMLMERDQKLTATAGGESVRRTSHYFNSFFMSRLLEHEKYTYSNVQRWSKKFDVFSKEKIFFPINISNAHWTMAVVFVQKKEIHYYDSMNGGGKRYLNALLQWLFDEAAAKKKTVLNKEEWKLIDREPDVPQQRNGVDCGVFSTICADFLSDDLPLSYSQQDMPEFRVKIGCAIVRGSINY